jgi:DNA-binding response OmpR family regulator
VGLPIIEYSTIGSPTFFIEDELNIAELERDYLEVNGYESDIATTGEEGLQKAMTNTYNLILLDLMLPGIDGFELCKHTRNIRYTYINGDS